MNTLHARRIGTRDWQRERWDALALTIGYRPGFVVHRATHSHAWRELFDHHRTVRHASGQHAFLADPYGPRDKLADTARAFAEAAGMALEYIGDGLWFPGETTALVLRVTDAAKARAIITDRDSNAWDRVCVRWRPAFMPRRA